MKIVIYASFNQPYQDELYELIASKHQLLVVFLSNQRDGNVETHNYEKQFISTNNDYKFNGRTAPKANAFSAFKRSLHDVDLIIIHGWKGSYWLSLIFLHILSGKRFWFFNDLSSPGKRSSNFRGVLNILKKHIIGRADGVIAASLEGLKYNRDIGAKKLILCNWRYLHLRKYIDLTANKKSRLIHQEKLRYRFYGRFDIVKGLCRIKSLCKELDLTVNCHGMPGSYKTFDKRMLDCGPFEMRHVLSDVNISTVVFLPSLYEPLGLIALELMLSNYTIVLSEEIIAIDQTLLDGVTVFRSDFTTEKIAALLVQIEARTPEEITIALTNRKQNIQKLVEKAENEDLIEDMINA